MEDLEQYRLNDSILCIDLKSFYASVECILRGLDPFKTPLVVADKQRGDGTIVLAVSPYLKTLGVPSRLRVRDLPKNIDIIFAKPSMQKYLEYSTQVIGIYLDYISEEDLYIYSIDEAFLDLTKYLKLYKKNAEEIANKILDDIYIKLGLKATCGIGPNMLISKLALDLESKSNKDSIANWNYTDIKEKLWNIMPLSKMWGIGKRMERRLNLLGFNKIGDIANSDKKQLKKSFGILGLELWYHSHGIDMSQIKDKNILSNNPKSFGTSQVLFKDYNAKEILTIILEMTDEVVVRLRKAKMYAKTISLSIGYSKDYYGGFSKQITLNQATASESLIYLELINIFDSSYDNYPIRRVSIGLSNLTESKTFQFSLFDDINNLEKEEEINISIDKIKAKYGKNAVTRAVSLEEHATGKQRNKQIGGHHV